MVHDEDKTIDQLNEEADIAADYLEGLLDVADYDGDIELGVRNGRPTVQIVPGEDGDEDIKRLVGKNGEVVDALQLLTRLAVQQKTGERSRLILDVDGYLRKRRKHLRDLTLDAIDDARDTGEPQDLEPMNSFERKVVHDIVREEGMKSRSHGEEPHRHVTIYMKASAKPVDDDDELDEDVDDVVDDSIDDTVESDAIDTEDDAVEFEEVVDVEESDDGDDGIVDDADVDDDGDSNVVIVERDDDEDFDDDGSDDVVDEESDED